MPLSAGSGPSSLDAFEGYYTAPATHCSMQDGDVTRPCDPPEEDCLLIKRVDDTHAAIKLQSIQSHGHECGVAGVAELKDGRLVYVDANPASPESGKGIALRLDGRKLKIAYLEKPDKDAAPFCGLKARLDWLVFALADRQPVGAHQCGP